MPTTLPDPSTALAGDDLQTSSTWQYVIDGLDQHLDALQEVTAKCVAHPSAKTATACCAESVEVFGYANDADLFVKAQFRRRVSRVLATLARACRAVLMTIDHLQPGEERENVGLYARNLATRYRLVEAIRNLPREEADALMNRYTKRLKSKDPEALRQMREDADAVAALAT
jgi:hypothetical protein